MATSSASGTVPLYPSARDWALDTLQLTAAAKTDGSEDADNKAPELSLGMLEAQAAQNHDRLLRTMGNEGRRVAHSKKPSALDGLGCLGALIGFALFLAPIAAWAAVLGDPRPRPTKHEFAPDVAIPLATWCMSGAVLVILWVIFSWLREGRIKGDTMGFGMKLQGSVTAIMAVLTALTVHNMDTTGLDEQARILTIVCVCAFAPSVLALALVQFFSSAETKEERDVRMSAKELENIPAQEQARVLTDRNAAIDVLAKEKAISAFTAVTAKGARLGTLHTLDPKPEKDRKTNTKRE